MTDKTDRLVTLFGGGGFIGRYVAQVLFDSGMRVRVAERDPKNAYSLKPLSRLGQLQLVTADIRRPNQVAAAVEGADAVINLVGVFGSQMDKVNGEGAGHVAEAAAAAGVEALVHLSAIGADPQSPSNYGRSKGEGEQAVRRAFPAATIIRPSIVFGPEDNFVNRFAGMVRALPVVPVIRGKWKVQPVYVADLGRAIAKAALEPAAHAGKTYELAGPQAIAMREFNQWIGKAIGRGSKPVIDLPDPVGAMVARLGFLPGMPVTWDQWLMLQQDNVPSGEHPGFEAFDMHAQPLMAVAEGWLPIYRRSGRWAAPSPY